MKFITTDTKHTEYEFFEDVRNDADLGKPRRMHYYYETARKAKNKNHSYQR